MSANAWEQQLALTAAKAVVKSLARGVTDSVSLVPQLWSAEHVDRQAIAVALIDAQLELETQASEYEVRMRHIVGWRANFAELLRADPRAAQSLRQLIAELEAAMSERSRSRSVSVPERDRTCHQANLRSANFFSCSMSPINFSKKW